MLVITENDTIYKIVTKYPGIKEKLKDISPRFDRLNHPVLFNTVAKVTTLKKAADIGKVYLREMLYQLNDFIGLSSEYLALAKKDVLTQQSDFLRQKPQAVETEPEWLKKTGNFEYLDVSEMIEDPFNKVIEKARSTKDGDGFILIQKFEPLPLISYLESIGFDHYTKIVSEWEYRVYFLRKEK